MMHLILALTSLLALTNATPTLQRRAATCGVLGFDKNSPNAYYFASDTTQPLCAASCAAQTGCNSYAFGNGNCLLYTSQVADNFVANAGSTYVFNDLSCVAPVAKVNTQSTCGTATVTVSGNPVTVSASAVTVTAAAAATTVSATVTVSGNPVTVSASAVTVTAAGVPTTVTVSASPVTTTVSSRITITSSATVTTATTVTVTATVTSSKCTNLLGLGC